MATALTPRMTAHDLERLDDLLHQVQHDIGNGNYAAQTGENALALEALEIAQNKLATAVTLMRVQT